LEERCRVERPALILVDIGARGVDWATAVEKLRSNVELADVPIVAFGPHKDLEARDRALAAGCTEVLANSKLLSDLPRIVSRYLEPV
jgi:CheY-like chemotaxis protein